MGWLGHHRNWWLFGVEKGFNFVGATLKQLRMPSGMGMWFLAVGWGANIGDLPATNG
jgi:hypothetical protein